jgi:hypothetical protein
MPAATETLNLFRPELVEEFRRTPIGRHSPDLRLLLNRMRTQQDPGYVLVCIEPFRRWRLARKKRGRGNPVELVGERVFTSPEEAEWEVFKLRWKEMTGEDLA